MILSKSSIEQSFRQSLDRYKHKEARGYKFGWFTNIRHSFDKNQNISKLESDIQQCSNEKEIMNCIIDYFLSDKTKFHNHSFSNYFIDTLKENIPNIEWDCFQSKKVSLYQGIVFRGTSQPTHKIFQNGFSELNHSDFLDDYIKSATGSIGISTSTEFNCARDYALNNKRTNPVRYIYVINYRGKGGHDIIETIKSRGEKIRNHFYTKQPLEKKAEINIKGNISPHDVIGAWELNQDNAVWHDNPNYHLCA